MAKCPNCGSSGTAKNDARGETVCTGCGAVLSEGEMVDQLTFASGGKMQGQFIDAMTGSPKGFVALYSSRESSETSLANGWHNLERIASRLNMPQSIVAASKRLYHLAFQRNFTLGRNNYYVVSACIYAVCRREKSANLLIDFSDALLTPVKTLAQVFMKLVRALTLEVPTVDPSLFMERFANEMDLGSKTAQVAQTGVRLVQAMTREWLATGRRPLGLCAASLLIAARYHGVKINASDINAVFRCAPCTVDKRLAEFKDTAVAKLKVKDFENCDLTQIQNLFLPPCLLKRSVYRRSVQQVLDSEANAMALTDGSDRTCEIPAAGFHPDQNLSLIGSISLSRLEQQDLLCRSDLSSFEVAELAGNMIDAVGLASQSLCDDAETGATLWGGGREISGLRDVIKEIGQNSSQIKKTIMKTVVPPLSAHLHVSSALPLPMAPSSENAIVVVNEGDDENDDEELSDIDGDEDVNDLMLSEEERGAKALVWDELTKDVMAMVHERLRERRARQEQMAANGRNVRRKLAPLPDMSSALDSARASLERASGIYKSKMNASALEELLT